MSADYLGTVVQVEKELGEARMIGWHGVGIAVAPEIKFSEITRGIEDKAGVCCDHSSAHSPITALTPARIPPSFPFHLQAREVFSKAVFQAVCSNYATLEEAVNGGKGLHAASTSCTLAQPWIR